MQRIKRFTPPTKDWKMFYQFSGLGILTAAFIGYAVAIWVALIIVVLSTIAGFFVNAQHYESKIKADEQAYHTYLIEFDSSDLIKGMTSTVHKHLLKPDHRLMVNSAFIDTGCAC